MEKILIVDDENDIAELISDILEDEGYETVIANDGKTAIKLVKEENFDLILLDVMMPNMDGWDTLKAIRTNKNTKYIPVIMITAVSEEHKIVSGLKIGADDYIVKPFVLPNLLARIEAILRRSKWQTEKTNTSLDISIKPEGDIEPLTEREKEVLSLVAKGASNQDIAKKLFVRDVTVKTHMNTIFKKLKVTNRTQAVLLALQTKIIS